MACILNNETDPMNIFCSNNGPEGYPYSKPSSMNHAYIGHSSIPMTNGDIIGFGLNPIKNNITFFKNGTLLVDTGDLSEWFTTKPTMTETRVYPLIMSYSGDYKIEVNYGQKDTYYKYDGYSTPRYYKIGDTVGIY